MIPEAPVNVRVQRADGTTVPVELTYEGVDVGGIHVWVATPTSPAMGPDCKLLADVVPAHTGIVLRCDGLP